jgi:starch-binding outer membrane protein, SusD/RagB family
MTNFRALRAVRWVAALAILPVACDLKVQDPDIVTPENITSAEALPTVRAAALGDFTLSYSGSGADGSGGAEGIVQMSGLLGDELINTETFPTRIEIDRRNAQITNGTLGGWFRTLSRARRSVEFAAQAYERFAPVLNGESGYPEMLSLSGFSYLFFAENWCSGVPFSTINEDGTFTFGQALTSRQMFDSSVARFSRAQTAALALDTTAANSGGGATRRAQYWLASVGLARATLGRDGAAAAAAVVTAANPVIPGTFSYTVTHSENTTRQNNGVFNAVNINERYGVADREGSFAAGTCTATTNCTGSGPGLPYRSDADPRINFTRTGGGTDVGFDRRTPQFDQRRYFDRRASVPVASGLEARLIRAENLLAAGASNAYLSLLDSLRASPPSYILGNNVATPVMGPLTDPVTAAGRVDQFFKERAYWLWLTGHRLGDMRRLMRSYGRTEAQVFPTGAYFKQNLQYDGTDVNFPVPIDEENNPQFNACIDRLP